MSDNNFGEIIHPVHCRASASSDRTKLALTFHSQDRTPLTIVLPLMGAAGLQRNLAQALYILASQPSASDTAPAMMPSPHQVAAE